MQGRDTTAVMEDKYASGGTSKFENTQGGEGLQGMTGLGSYVDQLKKEEEEN